MAGNRHDHNESPETEVRQPDPNHPETLYEHRDVNTWAVGKFGIGLALLCIAAVGLLLGVFKFFEAREGGSRPRSELIVDAGKLPPSPRLQVTPVEDITAIRAAEQQLLTSYGWVDQQKGTVRIPIARAMELLAMHPPASRPAAEIPPASDVSVPTDSSLGPKVQKPGGPLAAELEALSTPAPATGHALEAAHEGEKK
jgi:hypothetical protein